MKTVNNFSWVKKTKPSTRKTMLRNKSSGLIMKILIWCIRWWWDQPTRRIWNHCENDLIHKDDKPKLSKKSIPIITIFDHQGTAVVIVMWEITSDIFEDLILTSWKGIYDKIR